jgi:hypothetical protein
MNALLDEAMTHLAEGCCCRFVVAGGRGRQAHLPVHGQEITHRRGAGWTCSPTMNALLDDAMTTWPKAVAVDRRGGPAEDAKAGSPGRAGHCKSTGLLGIVRRCASGRSGRRAGAAARG